MKVRKVVIKGKIRRLIKEDGTWVYLKHRCGCPCKGRIHYKESQKRDGYIPEFIHGHNQKGKHHTKNTKQKMGDSKSGEKNPNYGKSPSEEIKSKIGKSLKKYNINHPDEIANKIKMLRIAHEKYRQEHPDHMKMMSKFYKSVSKPELIMRNYTIKKLNRLNVKYHLNLHEINGTPDITIETGNGHPIALFEDGCRWHGCSCIDWYNSKRVKYDEFLRMIKQSNYDRKINEKLTQQGYRVIRIWEHDVYNGNYKKIIKQIIQADSNPTSMNPKQSKYQQKYDFIFNSS